MFLAGHIREVRSGRFVNITPKVAGCKHCGKSIVLSDGPGGPRRYCDSKCCNKAKALRVASKRELEVRLCRFKHCRRRFTVSAKSTQAYCCSQCKKKQANSKRIVHPWMYCLVCGTRFSYGRKKKYCGSKCAAVGFAIVQADRRRKKPRDVVCIDCAKTFSTSMFRVARCQSCRKAKYE